MYPIERFLLTLKQYVRNQAHPNGSTAKGYLLEKCMNFCSRYLVDAKTKSNRSRRNNEGDNNMGRAVGESTTFYLNDNELQQSHR